MMQTSILAAALAVILFLLVTVVRKQRRLGKGQKRILAKLQAQRSAVVYHDINEYRQLTAYQQLQTYLRPRFILPPMRDWAISPDFAALLVRLIHDRQPKRIVEFGSGSSTLVCGYCLERLGGGEIISIDHDPEFADKTRKDLTRHDLARWADVRVAERRSSAYLDDTTGQPVEWYDTDVVDSLPGDIDLVIVDGPPGSAHPFARYPALPALAQRLSANATLVLDDADRPGEQATLARWQHEFQGMALVFEATEKGAAVLTASP